MQGRQLSSPCMYSVQRPVRSRTRRFAIAFEMELRNEAGALQKITFFPVKAGGLFAFGATREALLGRLKKIVHHLPNEVGAFSVVELKRGEDQRPDFLDRFLIVDDPNQVLCADSLKNAACDETREIYEHLVRGRSFDQASILAQSLWVTYKNGRDTRATFISPVMGIQVLNRKTGKRIRRKDAYALPQRRGLAQKISDFFTIKIT